MEHVTFGLCQASYGLRSFWEANERRRMMVRRVVVPSLLGLGLVLAIGGSSAVSKINASSLSFRWGPLVVTPTPPSPGFNPLTATNAELRANGFPERPPGPVPKWWLNAVEHAHHWVYPHFTSHPSTTGGSMATKK